MSDSETPTTSTGRTSPSDSAFPTSHSALDRVYRAIDAEQGRFVADLQRLVRQPSISSQNVGVRECAELLVAMMAEVGIAGRVLETDGLPVVYGEIHSPRADAPTLVIYNHYDVQPPEPLEEWTHPPFGAEIVGDRLIGRGATDAKGNLMCHLKAVDAYRRAGVDLPCHLKFIFDGEEESGSPSLPAFVAAHTELLAADAALSFDGGFEASDRPRIGFGSSGLLYVEIRVKGAAEDLHSARARLVENPAWRLVWALASLKGPDERVTLEGFYEPIRPPSAVERAALERAGWDDEAQLRDLGVTRFLGGVSGVAALERLLFTPTCNIAGFATGWMGEGHKTVLPSRAACRLDFRLVADQDPGRVAGLFRRWLADQVADGVDVDVEQMGGVAPALTPVDHPAVAALSTAIERVWGQPPLFTREGGSGPEEALGRVLDAPVLYLGVGLPDDRYHAPNERMVMDQFWKGLLAAGELWGELSRAHV